MSLESPSNIGQIDEALRKPSKRGAKSELQRQVEKEIAPPLREMLTAEQYSAYHTEGERTVAHLQLMNRVLEALQNNDLERLPEGTREALKELDPSVVKTINGYPGVLRYLMLTHDLAKTRANRSINLTEFKLPAEQGDYPSEVWEAMQALATGKKDLAELKKKKDEAGVAQREQKVQADYDVLLKHFGSSEAVYRAVNLGIGFIGHEKKSAEIVAKLNLPADVKELLIKLVERHVVPLQSFAQAKDLGKAYNSEYGGDKFTYLEFRLATAFAALDILASTPASGNPDLTPIKNMLIGHHDAWIGDRVKEEEKGLQETLLSERLPEGVTAEEFQAGLKSNKDYQNLNKEIKKETQERLTKKWTAEYEKQFP